MKTIIGHRSRPRAKKAGTIQVLKYCANPFFGGYGGNERVAITCTKKVADVECPKCHRVFDLSVVEDLETGLIFFEGPNFCECGHTFAVDKEKLGNGPKLSEEQIVELFGPAETTV